MLPILFLLISLNAVIAAEHSINETSAKSLGDIKKTSSIFGPKYPRNCAEAVRAGDESGIYKIQIPNSKLEPFYVYCQLDPDGKAAWTVIQRRVDLFIDFYRNWDSYEIGFGNLDGGHFIGLKKLHALTHDRVNELWIQLEDFDKVKTFAKYRTFAIGNEKENYTLNSLGTYSGTAGDSLWYNAGQQFSTKDRENNGSNCAKQFTGAWWYRGCSFSNLNGRYYYGNFSGTEPFGSGVVWSSFRGQEYSLKYAQMAIRPRLT